MLFDVKLSPKGSFLFLRCEEKNYRVALEGQLGFDPLLRAQAIYEKLF